MNPAIYTIPTHYRGDTLNSITFTIKENTIAVDLTGASIKMDFRRGTDTGALQESKTIGSGLLVTDAVNGVFEMIAYINNWEAGVYFYDMQITFPSSIIRTYVKGTLTVKQDVAGV